MQDPLSHFSPPTLPLAVAYSGGADSTFLLHHAVNRWPGYVVAWHINHQLQAAATHFEAHCKTVCQHLQVPLHIAYVNAQPSKGQSPEDAARIARYDAFRTLSQNDRLHEDRRIQTILLAQHGDDQIETFLLALMRGAGLAGLSAMPASWQDNGVHYARPLLRFSSEAIRSWLHERNIAYINDPSNADIRYTRNKIRLELLPVLERLFPHYLETMNRSIGHIAQASTLLDTWMQQEWESLRLDERQIQLDRLRRLPDAQMACALRYWLKTIHNTIPSQAQLHALINQVRSCSTKGHKIYTKAGSGFVIRHKEGLDWYNPTISV